MLKLAHPLQELGFAIAFAVIFGTCICISILICGGPIGIYICIKEHKKRKAMQSALTTPLNVCVLVVYKK